MTEINVLCNSEVIFLKNFDDRQSPGGKYLNNKKIKLIVLRQSVLLKLWMVLSNTYWSGSPSKVNFCY